MSFNRKYVVLLVWIAFIGFITVFLHVAQFSIISDLQRELVNTFHAPGFGAISVVSMLILRQRTSPARAYVIATAFSFGLGLLSEFAQFLGPRDADIGDLLRDISGIIGFLGVAAALDPALNAAVSWLRRPLSLVVISFVALIAIAPTTWYAYSLVEQYRALPYLAKFDSPWESGIYGTPWRPDATVVEPPEHWPNRRGGVMSLSFHNNRVPVVILTPYPDWTQRSVLSFSASSGSEKEIEISVSIRDKLYTWQDRGQFVTKLSIGSSVKRYAIPIRQLRTDSGDRKLVMTAITGVVVAIPDAVEGDVVYVDDFKLE